MEFDVVQGDIAAQSADALDCASVVLPALGCGIAAFDPDSLTEVQLIAYDDAEFERLREIAAEVQA